MNELAYAHLTKDQIASVKKQLADQYNTVWFDCDGYLVTACLMRIGKLKLGIRVYVNGCCMHSWLLSSSEAEEGRRFYRLATRRLHSAKALSDLVRAVGKRSKIYKEFASQTYSYRAYYWTSAASMLRHFHDNNASVRLLDEAEAKLRMEALQPELAAAREAALVTKAGAE
ncbi:hypothetical protein [Oceanibaculum indicum]|uniref:Uncharacterized protein n=1 Tax=Oceanibaculum indicum P24 TaxID=1207063 RepID=K2KLX3_9PROT|nr:hypothetical protein [Oceanibaculum indicum]EKE78455.1 hypothetical protein P24_02806 [Oceanibaculum indicum P24]